MFILGIVAVCVVLFLLALLAPRLSRRPQNAVDSGLGAAARAGSKAPGPLGRFLSRSFATSRRAADKSAAAGRRTRDRTLG